MARVALYGGGGSPYNHAAILAAAGHEVAFVFPVDVLAGALDSFDAFVMPGGGYESMRGQLDPLGAEGMRTIREFVGGGGMYIGSCAGSYDAATVPQAFLDLVPAQSELRLVDARVWNDGASTLGVIQSPGIGELVARNAAPSHPVMAGMPEEFRITHYNGPLFVGGSALATVVGTTQEFTPAERFLGGEASELLVDEGIALGVSNIVADEYQDGRVVLFGSHPEFGSELALDDVGPAATMLLNAVRWQLAAHANAPKAARVPLVVEAAIPADLRAADLAALPGLVSGIAARAAQLAEAGRGRPWLADDQAMGMLGVAGQRIWDEALRRLPELAAEAAAGAESLPEWALSFRSPAEWRVDGGFWGVSALLEQTLELLDAALAASGDSFPADDGYDHMRRSPYHLVAGSYLAAIGRAAGAALLVRGLAASEPAAAGGAAA
ncbi:MAG TPA: BPL-N domain-containing protein [Gryllotalpicola sp.]